MSLKSTKRRIKKLLIANRGEIAMRILRTAREMGIESVIVYEQPDCEAYYMRFADETLLIGDGPRKDYLDIEKIIWAAKKTGADAIHPGYGFLSEDPDFAEACERARITFIGPPSRVIKILGNKVIAREAVRRADIPFIPGTYDISAGDRGYSEAMAFCHRYGYPVMIKSSGGGGGRGIRRVNSEEELFTQLRRARSEVRKAFKNEAIFMERCIVAPRHIEVQVLGDSYGNVIHLGTRDCSIQRRHQKLLEIAPAKLPPDVTEAICRTAVRAAKEVGYVNAGTVEFLVDSQTNEFWFMEMNTRLQVEHTVTEELVNIDLIREQIRIAEGNRIQIPPSRIRFPGKAIQVRINAEDPLNNFMPDGGKVVSLYMQPGGPGIRLDGIAYQGYRVPTEYDSLLVKMTVRGYNWQQTVQRLERALSLFLISGPKTTIPFYRAICANHDFREENFNTEFIPTHHSVFKYLPPVAEIKHLEEFISEVHTSIFFPNIY
ncbi:MAG: biotin carboxylase N-terminal domain-containing protein [Syntrophaceae bacterium]